MDGDPIKRQGFDMGDLRRDIGWPDTNLSPIGVAQVRLRQEDQLRLGWRWSLRPSASFNRKHSACQLCHAFVREEARPIVPWRQPRDLKRAPTGRHRLNARADVLPAINILPPGIAHREAMRRDASRVDPQPVAGHWIGNP